MTYHLARLSIHFSVCDPFRDDTPKFQTSSVDLTTMASLYAENIPSLPYSGNSLLSLSQQKKKTFENSFDMIVILFFIYCIVCRHTKDHTYARNVYIFDDTSNVSVY